MSRFAQGLNNGIRIRGALRATLLALASVTAACTYDPVRVTDERLQVTPDTPAGFVVGTVGRVAKGEDRSTADANDLRVRSVATGATFIISFNAGLYTIKNIDIREEAKELTVFRIPLPRGEYEIYKARFFLNAGYWTEDWTHDENFSLLFTVEEGTEVYLGEILARGKWAPNMLGIKMPAGYRFDLTDRRDRDFEALKQKFPDFDQERTVVQVLASAIIIEPPVARIIPTARSATDAPPESP